MLWVKKCFALKFLDTIDFYDHVIWENGCEFNEWSSLHQYINEQKHKYEKMHNYKNKQSSLNENKQEMNRQ